MTTSSSSRGWGRGAPAALAVGLAVLALPSGASGAADILAAHQVDDADPTNDANCLTGSTQSANVRAAELEVFDKAGSW